MAGLADEDVPKSIALPAAAAAAGYLNAKLGVAWDLWSFWALAYHYSFYMGRLEKKDRMNLFYRLEELAKDTKTANRTFLIVPKDDDTGPDQKTEWTYAEAYELVLQHAAWLKHRQQVRRKEIVAMAFTNRPQFVWVWFALWSLGAIPAFINHNLRDKAFVHCVRISNTRLLLLESSLEEILTNEVLHAFEADGKGRAIESVLFDDQVQQDITSQSPYRAPDEERSGDHRMSTSLLIYTSGTTGLPKAADVGWNKPWSGIVFFSRLVGMRKDDHYLTALPLYHTSGSLLGVLQVMRTGAAVVVCPKFSPRTFMRYVHETKATGIHYIGEMCRYLVSSLPTPYDRAHNVRFAYGNGLCPDVWQRFKDRFNIPEVIEFYGATEGTGLSCLHSRNTFLNGAIGKRGFIFRNIISSFVMVKHDPNTDMPWRDPQTGFCVKCETNEPGEVLNPLVPDDIEASYLGYYGNETATDSKVLRNVFKKGDAYYRTGDLQKEDADGRVYFVDRIGDTFRWKSENVSTQEVSQAMGTHPQVSEANVYGVELPNFDGRAGCAAIVLANDQRWDDRVAKSLANHARQQLPQYAVPIFLRVMKQVEVTGTLKHQKVDLRKASVDPGKVGEDEIYWLERGAEKYEKFDSKDWKRISSGDAKL